MQNEDPLFKSAHSALVFAFNYSSQQYDRPMMNRMADGPKREGMGLAGLDGAAQAGMIRSALSGLPGLSLAILAAKFAPPSVPCSCRAPCCSEQRPNKEWLTAIETIANAAIMQGIIAGKISHYRLRAALVGAQFTKGVKISAVADVCGVSRSTASEHNAKIELWLSGGYRGKSKVGHPKIGEIERAVAAASDILHDAGYIKE